MLLPIEYLVLASPAVLFAIWAKWHVASAWRGAGARHAGCGLTGAELARRLIDSAGASGVRIEMAHGELDTYYDRARRMLRLSPRVYSGMQAAALGTAAHEAGHVLQELARRPWPLILMHDPIAQSAGVISTFFWMLMLSGAFLEVFRLVLASLGVLIVGLLIQLINLPIEMDASRFAQERLDAEGLIRPEEHPAFARALRSACWMPTAATLWSFLSLPATFLR